MTRLIPEGNFELFASQDPPGGYTSPTVPPVGLPQFSLVFVVDRTANKVLLGLKKRGFATGILNGFGGKPKLGEDIAACAVRETLEECGLRIALADLNPVGELTVVWTNKPSASGLIYIYLAERWEGDPVETDEMAPRWVSLEEIPYDQMNPEAVNYIPAILGPHAKSKMMVGRIARNETDNLWWWMGWIPKTMEE